MKTKHTQREWIIDDPKNPSFIIDKDRIPICQFFYKDETDIPNKKANAKLIASAPELLECLISMTDYIMGLDSEQRVVLRIPMGLSEKIGKVLQKFI